MKEQIKDIYDGLAILLVFITILMNNSQSEAEKIMDKNIPSGRKNELVNKLKDINRFIFNKWIILFVVNLILVWILTPMAIFIMKSSTISLINFDTEKTIYIFIYIIMLGLSVKYILTTKKLYNHRKSYKEEIKEIQ